MERPFLQNLQGSFTPAPELSLWAERSFLLKDAPLFNPDHQHLQEAHIGWLWATIENSRGGKRIIGQCEIPNPKGGKWQVERQYQQLVNWFGDIPDFLITLDALALAEFDDVSFCAVVEHELYHAGQQMRFGCPVFTRKGKPKFALIGHDYEGFVGTVRRYGITEADQKLIDLFEASKMTPLIGAAQIAGACGNCIR